MTFARTHPRVAVVSTTIPRTAHQFYGDIIDRLHVLGYQVHIITSDGPEIATLRARAGHVHIIEMAREVSLGKDLTALWKWITVLARIRPALIIAGTPKAGLLGMLSSAVIGVPRRAYFLQGLRLEGVHGWRRGLLSLMEWLSSRCSHVVIAVSPSLARVYRQSRLHAGRPIKVPHNGSSHGVDASHFSPRQTDPALLRALGLSAERPIVAFLGRLTADKGPATLAAALGSLRKNGIPVQLVLLGAQDESDSSAHLTKLADERGWVAIVNHVEDVRPYLAAAQVVALPTRREGFPNVILEAAAMSIPAVTTHATGAIDSVVHGVTGLLVPPDDPDALAAALGRLLMDDALRTAMGLRARERVMADFQPTDVARTVVAIALGSREDSFKL